MEGKVVKHMVADGLGGAIQNQRNAQDVEEPRIYGR
jgi:hypothetical protein